MSLFPTKTRSRIAASKSESTEDNDSMIKKNLAPNSNTTQLCSIGEGHSYIHGRMICLCLTNEMIMTLK